MGRHLKLMLMLIGLLWPLVCGASESADPFAYCATVGMIDTPDARYTGPQTPEAIVRGFLSMFWYEINK